MRRGDTKKRGGGMEEKKRERKGGVVFFFLFLYCLITLVHSPFVLPFSFLLSSCDESVK
mgnify:CR=1 FL=1